MICCEYVQWSAHARNRPDAKDVIKLVGDVDKAAKRLLSAVAALSEVGSEGLTQAQQVASSHIGTHLRNFRDVAMYQGTLYDLLSATGTAKKNINEMVGPRKPGPQTDNQFWFLFNETGRLFKEITGRKPTAYWSEYKDNDKTVTPFIEFVFGLAECAPLEFRPASKEALAERFRRYAREVKIRRGKSFDEFLDFDPFTPNA